MKPTLFLLPALSLLLTVGSLSSCSPPNKDDAQNNTEATATETILVRCIRPTSGALSARLEVSARVEAFEKVDVFPRLQGVVTAIHKVEGDTVTEGDVLAEIESEEYRIALKTQEIAVTQAKRSVSQATLALEEVKAQAEGQEASLAREQRRLTRAEEQRRAEVITDEQLEEIRSSHDVALAESKRLKISIKRLLEDIQLKKLMEDSARSSMETAALRCEWANIRATIAGRITTRSLHLGQQAQVAAPAYAIADLSSLVIHAGIPQKDLRMVKKGLHVALTSTAWPGEEFKGEVDFISPEVDVTTGTVSCRIRLSLEEGRLRPGLFVSGHLVTETREGILLVPRRAVLFDRDKLFVFVIDPPRDGVRNARKVYLERGLEDANNMQCLPVPGLPMNIDQTTDIVLVGMDRLLDGSAVELESDAGESTKDTASTR